MNTKMVMAAVGVATLLAAPALAKTVHRVSNPSAPYAGASVSPRAVVAYDGRVIGADPDPSIRFELERDSATYTTGN